MVPLPPDEANPCPRADRRPRDAEVQKQKPLLLLKAAAAENASRKVANHGVWAVESSQGGQAVPLFRV